MNDPLEGLSRDELRQLALESMIRLEKAGKIKEVIEMIKKTPAGAGAENEKKMILSVATALDK